MSTSNLKNLIKQAQKGSVPAINDKVLDPLKDNGSTLSNPIDDVAEIKPTDNVSINTNHAVKKRKEGNNQKKPKTINSIVDRIKSQNKSGLDDHMLHIRIKPEVYQKLLLYGLGTDKLSMQSIATYAIDYLLEQEEMKKLLNNIKDGMV